MVERCCKRVKAVAEGHCAVEERCVRVSHSWVCVKERGESAEQGSLFGRQLAASSPVLLLEIVADNVATHAYNAVLCLPGAWLGRDDSGDGARSCKAGLRGLA